MSATLTPRTNLINQIRLLLGDGMSDVELDPEHYELAVTLAVEKMYQRSDGALQEQTMFLKLEADQTEYTLPNNIQEIWKLHRRGVGTSIGGSGVNFDPVDASITNYFLLNGGKTGGLATWELYGEYRETLSRLFASEINFIWNYDNHTLTILRRPEGNEIVMLTVYARKHEDDMITNPYSGPWVRDFALAQSKFMLGEARSKFPGGLPGPQGAVVLNGDQLKAEALQDMERLENEIQNFVPASDGLPFIIG